MWYKALLKGTFQFPNLQNYSSAGLEIESSTLRMILDGIDLSSIRRRHRFRLSRPAQDASQPYDEDAVRHRGAQPPLADFHAD